MSGPFQRISFSEANPLLQGLMQTQQAINQGITNQYLPQQMNLQNQLLGAKAKRENAMANLPFGGATLPGVAGQIQGLETVKQLYGENSPQFQQAKGLFDLNMMNTQSRINYQNALTGSMPVRYLTTTGKGNMERFNVGQGLNPAGMPWGSNLQPPSELPLSEKDIQTLSQALGQTNSVAAPGMNTSAIPGTPEELANQYDLLNLKNVTDPDTRKRARFAANVEKTLANINPQDLMTYGGLAGKGSFLKDELMASLGMPSKRYQDYQNALNLANFLKDQTTQFYGSSIQPSMVQEKLARFSPAAWNVDPETAVGVFNTGKNVLNQEIQTFWDALKNTDVYKQSYSENIKKGAQKGNFEIPQFKSKGEFQVWYGGLPPDQQKLVREQMKG